jgi:TRAP-type C4-dicarboxylate transport system substrate-binding protein
MPAFKVLLVAMKARRGWQRIPPAQRRAILEAAGRSAKKHGPTVARTVKQRGPTMARQLAKVLRESRKRP